MESVSSIRYREIPVQLRNIDAFVASYAKSLQSLRAAAHQSSPSQVQSEEFKGKLREADDDLVKAIAVKTRKEAKRIALVEAIASAKGRVDELKTCIEQRLAKKQEFQVFLSQQSLGNDSSPLLPLRLPSWKALAASEGNLNESIELEDETLEAISWYNRVLGFHVEGGRGVKLTFKNINLNSPTEEYSFTIHHENNTCVMLSCEPSLEDSKELIHELNKTKGLFKFVRVMRKKFQEVVVQGSLVPTTVEREESAFISASAPVLSMSYFRSDSTTEENEHEVEPIEVNTLNKQHIQRRLKSAVLSPGSASSVCQSPRLKAMGYDEIKL